MRQGWMVCFALVTGCSSTSTSPPTCDVGGTYVVTYSRDTTNPGTCSGAGSFTPDTVTIRQTQGDVALGFQGVAGTCSGTVDASTCKVTANCPFGGAGSSVGDGMQISWAIDRSKTVTGFSAYAITVSGKQCTANANVSGVPK